MKRRWAILLVSTAALGAAAAAFLIGPSRDSRRSEEDSALLSHFARYPERPRAAARAVRRSAPKPPQPAKDTIPELLPDPAVAALRAKYPTLVDGYLAQLALVAATTDEQRQLISVRASCFERMRDVGARSRRGDISREEERRQVAELIAEDHAAQKSTLGDERSEILADLARVDRFDSVAKKLKEAGFDDEAKTMRQQGDPSTP